MAFLGIESVEDLRKEDVNRGLGKSEVLAGDAAVIDFPDRVFDHVVTIGVLR
ncbi:MAG: hypothetical protein KDA44_06690 [Planctomycetales bacterium]|nr:hypothetical protein [Planctomycetales bacterium]